MWTSPAGRMPSTRLTSAPASAATWCRCRSRKGRKSRRENCCSRSIPGLTKAQYDQAVGQVNLYKAQLELAKANYARDKAVAKTPGAVSMQQLDQDKAAVDEADAAVKAFQASLEVYKLNLSFTKVISPIDGQVSRYYLTLGNLVTQDQTLLTTVVSLDPIYVYFDIDEGTMIRVRKAINEGTIKRYQQGEMPVYMALQGEEGFPHKGTIDFVNNQVNPNTGSISVRGVFANPKPANGRPHAVAGDVCAGSLADGPAAPGDLGHRPGRWLRSGLEVCLRRRRQEQGPVSQRIDRRLQEDGLRVITEGLQAGRVGRGRRIAAGPPRRGNQAGPEADALLWPVPSQRAGRRQPRQPQTGRPASQAAARRPAQAIRGVWAMSAFSHFFIDRPIFATVVSIVITLTGAIALVGLPIAQYPQITPPSIQVTINYPGASTRWWPTRWPPPIEQQVNGVEGMLYMSSQMGNDGSYTLTVTFDVGTDLNTALVMVQNRVTLAMPQSADRRCRTRGSRSASGRPTS